MFKKFIFTLLFISCNKTIDIPTVKLVEIKKINQLSDSTFFSDVRSISTFKNKYFLSDYRRNQIIVLNNDLTLHNTIGHAGGSPGGFKGISNIQVEKDTIYSMNDGKRTIEVYSYDGYIKTIHFPKEINLFTHMNFVKINKYYFLSNLSKTQSVSIYNSENKEIKNVGSLLDFKSVNQKQIRNKRHIVKKDNLIFSVSDNIPEIEIMDNKGKLLSRFNYSHLKIIDEKIKYEKKKKLDDFAYMQLVTDVDVFLNKIYLTLFVYDKDNGSVESNIILELTIQSNNTLEFERFLFLGKDVWITSIACNNNSLLAFDSVSSTLIQYSLP